MRIKNLETSIANRSVDWFSIFEQFSSSYQISSCGPADNQQFHFKEFIPIDKLTKVAKIYKCAYNICNI